MLFKVGHHVSEMSQVLKKKMFAAFCFEFLLKSNDLKSIDSVPRSPVSPLKSSHDCYLVTSHNNDRDDLCRRRGETLHKDTFEMGGGGGSGVASGKAVKITVSEGETESEAEYLQTNIESSRAHKRQM